MKDTQRWQAVMRRDARFDRAFVYAVRSTGVYCRPSCPSRRPARRQVIFFMEPERAELEGFRACRRCGTARSGGSDPLLEKVREVCRYIDEQTETTPTLRALATRAGLSPFHLQRTFKRITGVSPRQYADERRMTRLRVHL